MAAHDGDPDAVPHHPDRQRRAGNHVILEVAPDQYMIVAHLQAGSVAVRVGHSVDRGEVIGRVGNSGNTSEPHVHVHLQDRAAPDQGEAIPLLFSNYRLESSGREVDRGMPRVITNVDGSRWVIFFYGCEAGDVEQRACISLQYFVGYNMRAPVSAVTMHKWNTENRYARAYSASMRDKASSNHRAMVAGKGHMKP